MKRETLAFILKKCNISDDVVDELHEAIEHRQRIKTLYADIKKREKAESDRHQAALQSFELEYRRLWKECSHPFEYVVDHTASGSGYGEAYIECTLCGCDTFEE